MLFGISPALESPAVQLPSSSTKRRASAVERANEPPTKKTQKWSAEENALLTELRGARMKWDDISKRFPGRSTLSCRLHYQNFLEKRAEWDEDKRTKLSRLYERYELFQVELI